MHNEITNNWNACHMIPDYPNLNELLYQNLPNRIAQAVARTLYRDRISAKWYLQKMRSPTQTHSLKSDEAISVLTTLIEVKKLIEAAIQEITVQYNEE